MKLHNYETWFEGIDLIEYFEATDKSIEHFGANTLGSFKVQHTLYARKPDLLEIIKSVLNLNINVMINQSNTGILQKIPFSWLEKDTQYQLRQAAMEATQYAVREKTVWERLNATSISTPNFNISEDPTNWLKEDIFGQFTIAYIRNSGIADYAIYGKPQLVASTDNENLKIVGSIDELVAKELTL